MAGSDGVDVNTHRLTGNGLFIVGHARSGTTVLQYALNSSPDIHLFGEANFHNHDLRRDGFADWYNTMHESFANPPAKGDRCPAIPGTLKDVLRELNCLYKWVGDKIAFRDEILGYSFEASYRFQLLNFPKSVYICTLRNPYSTLLSNKLSFNPPDLDVYIRSYLNSIFHSINTYLSFDRTLIAHYDIISVETFNCIAGYIEVSLDQAFSEYDDARRASKAGALDAACPDKLAVAVRAYDELCALMDPKTMRIRNRGALRRLQRELHHQVAQMRNE